MTEPLFAGYTTAYAGCTSITIVSGQTATCTITNNDIAPPPPVPSTLVVIKLVVNDNGGTMTAADFGFVVNGGAIQAFGPVASTIMTVGAGNYDVTEPSVKGYAQSFVTCTGIILPRAAPEHARSRTTTSPDGSSS